MIIHKDHRSLKENGSPPPSESWRNGPDAFWRKWLMGLLVAPDLVAGEIARGLGSRLSDGLWQGLFGRQQKYTDSEILDILAAERAEKRRKQTH